MQLHTLHSQDPCATFLTVKQVHMDLAEKQTDGLFSSSLGKGEILIDLSCVYVYVNKLMQKTQQSPDVWTKTAHVQPLGCDCVSFIPVGSGFYILLHLPVNG